MTITHKTGLIALAVALMAAALLMPPTAASANEDVVDDAVFALAGTAHLSAGIQTTGNQDGCLGGVAVGGGTANGGGFYYADWGIVTGVPNAGAQFTYNNTLITGDAKGDLWINGLELPSGDETDVKTKFDWERTGFVALVDLGDDGNDPKTLPGNEYGIAVAALLPVDFPVFDCTGVKKDPKSSIVHGDWPNEEHAQVVGVGVITKFCDTDPDPEPGVVPCNNAPNDN